MTNCDCMQLGPPGMSSSTAVLAAVWCVRLLPSCVEQLTMF